MNKKILIIGFLLMLLFLVGCSNKLTCKGDVKGSDDLYYQKIHLSNISSDNSYYCKTRSRAQDNFLAEQQKQENILQSIRKECYLAGKDYNKTFDLIVHYNLSCEKIAYINDHLLMSSNKRDAGNIKGEVNRFFSNGKLEGNFYQWVYDENLATGELVKNVAYHLDCNNTTSHWKKDIQTSKLRDTTVFEYYNEKDFVIYYTNNCI